jgi:protein-disulfide isomerase
VNPGRRSLAVLAALVLLGFALSWLIGRAAPVGTDLGDSAAARAVLAEPGFPEYGPADADLTVVVFADYACTACRIAAPELERAAARDGRVRLVYRDWPVFGPRSERAARIALAARGQGIYPRLHNALMAAPGLDEASLRAAVAGSGGDWSATERALAADAAGIDRLMAQSARDAFQLGLPGTPGYLVGHVLLVGAHDEAEFARAFARARKGGRQSGL